MKREFKRGWKNLKHDKSSAERDHQEVKMTKAEHTTVQSSPPKRGGDHKEKGEVKVMEIDFKT